MKKPRNRNPIAKAVTRIRPQVIADKRRKLKEKAIKKDTRYGKAPYDAD